MSTFSYKAVLIVGATGGIGRDLAYHLHDLPSAPMIIASGRRRSRLEEIQQARPRIQTKALDLGRDARYIKAWTDSLIAEYPELDCVIICASIQSRVDPSYGDIDFSAFQHEMHVNFASQVALATYLTTHFKQKAATGPAMMAVCTSNLAFVPAIHNPFYCPSKSALRSFILCFRQKLRLSRVKVVEIIVPLVESELHDNQGSDLLNRFRALWMPLSKFTPTLVQGLINGEEELWLGIAEHSKHVTQGEVKDIVAKELWI